jgi:hexokinase
VSSDSIRLVSTPDGSGVGAGLLALLATEGAGPADRRVSRA